MKPDKPTRDRNEGEGSRTAARHYNDRLRDHIAGGKVEPSSRVSVDELVAMGRTVTDRVRPIVIRAVGRLRHRFARK